MTMFSKEFQISSHSIKVQLKTEWNSEEEEHRLNIRKDLASLFPEAQKELLDLKTIPQLNNFHTSISHCPQIGGYASCETAPIGMDIEVAERIKPEVVQRFTKSDEFENCSKPRLLWCAREALFKSLYGPQQKDLDNKTRVTQWEQNNDLWLFKIDYEGLIIGKGLCWEQQGLILSLVVITS